MRKSCFGAAAVIAAVLATALAAAHPAEARDGCGANRYRGPGGACHWFGSVPIRMGSTARAWPRTAALPVTGMVRGVIAAIRPIMAGCLAAAGNDGRKAARSIFRPRGA